MLTRSQRSPPATQWWTKVQGEKFVRYELAGNHSRDWSAEARRLLGAPASDSLTDVDWIEYRDPKRRIYRAAWFVGDRLEGCIYFDRLPALPERAWLASMFAQPKLDAPARASLMAGRALEGSDQGALVCSCFGVGTNPIAACARELGAAATPAEIGKRLKCGTNCGSCIPEIQVIIGGVSKKSA
jgi:assimilatory nitrate reductase catalytic subunit